MLALATAIPEDLHSVVASTWAHTTSAEPEELTAADECTYLVVQLSTRPTAFVCGPEPTFRPITAAPNGRFLGIRLRPGTAASLLGVPGRELAGKMFALDDLLDSRAQRRFADGITDRETTTFEGIFGFLRDRARSPRRTRDHLQSALALLSSEDGVAIERVVRELQTSERTLRRAFADEIGLAPKLFTRIVRFRRAAEGLRGATSLAALAADCGFSDHAHMTREFVALAGLAPSTLQRTALPFMPGPPPSAS